MTTCELTILMPCLNEERTIAASIAEAQGYLTPQQAREALAQLAQLSEAAAARAGGAFADWVMSSGPEFLTRKTTEDVQVVTTFDPRVQRAAAQLEKRHARRA